MYMSEVYMIHVCCYVCTIQHNIIVIVVLWGGSIIVVKSTQTNMHLTRFTRLLRNSHMSHITGKMRCLLVA